MTIAPLRDRIQLKKELNKIEIGSSSQISNFIQNLRLRELRIVCSLLKISISRMRIPDTAQRRRVAIARELNGKNYKVIK